jgi:hypothetical protein
MRRNDRIVSVVALLVVGAAVALYAIWWVVAGVADGCAWFLGFGGCR